MAHDATARREATAVPLVLFGDYGRTVLGYRPADEDLVQARPARSHKAGSRITGPHLRSARSINARNRTGIVGISYGTDRARGRSYYWVNLGSSARKFCIETLGRSEAWRRAVNLRLEHLKKLSQANALILEARRAHSNR